MSAQLDALKERLARLSDLSGLGSLASWDQQTKMPERGGEARATSLATLTAFTHELFVDAETGRLLDAAAAEIDGGPQLGPDSDDARLIALTRRQWEKARRVPSSLAAELAHAASAGQEAWVRARENSDFAGFAPYLERNLELARRYAECHSPTGAFACAYDVLLDDYEPDMASAEVARLFAELGAELVPLIAAVAAAPPVEDGPLTAPFPVPGQRRVVRAVLGMMGFEETGWRIDDTVHPFAMSVAAGDVRVTTRFEEAWWPTGLFGAMHECGHGLYEDGIDTRFARSPLGSIQSLALHESQSRLWENMVGRGRSFAEVLAPLIAAEAPALATIDPDRLYHAVNRTGPSLIRVEADEATYSLHIIVRFELEQELLEGRLAVRELPEAWNARMRDYFDLDVPSDAEGVLQDVHWSAGLIGYFPTYALGNLIAGQLWERALVELDGLGSQLAAGELSELREWLRRRVHVHGAKYSTGELLRREAGGAMEVGPFVRYLKAKLSDVYGLDLTTSETGESE